MLGATDQLRSLFLKGFKLSKQGNYEDPTYLGFKLVFDFGTLPVRNDDGLPPSPLFKNGSYLDNDFFGTNPFGQPQYSYKSNPNGNISFYSAAEYLRQREDDFIRGGKRSDMLIQFRNTFSDLLNNSPWFIQSIQGLDKLPLVARGGFPTQFDFLDEFSSQRTAGKVLQFGTLESLNLRMTALADLYNQATFDYDNMRELLPRNLRRFTMFIFVSEIRNFFKTSRLIGSSSALTTINNLSNLLGSGNNPGTNLGGGDVNQEYNSGSSNINPSSSFNSFVGNILNQAGVDNDLSLFRNQQDQSGIKPVIMIECRNCEFDFSESTPIPSEITVGTMDATPVSQSFKIHVGRVRVKTQYPNIRQDGKPLVLGDSWDGARSSVQKNPNNLSNDIFSIGEELLTNFISNSLNDMINEGVANFVQSNVSGLDTLVMGNIYSLNPSQVLGNLSFNNTQQFFDQLGNINPGFRQTTLPNPQTTGQGGPPERVYPPSKGDVYPGVPGPDLGVSSTTGVQGRVYPTPSGDSYPGVPGPDLGVPGRVYNTPSGDAYPDVPGVNLGVPDRIYPAPGGDVYADVPGPDLGVPDRIYPAPGGDVYADVPGSDLGVPNRVYPAPSGDVYADVPGSDLGVPNRIYPAPGGDVYSDVPGSDLGAPDRVYPAPGGDVYVDVPGSDLGAPDRVYPAPGGDVYADVPGSDLGVPQRTYKSTEGNVYSDSSEIGNTLSPQKIYPDTISSRRGVSSIETNPVYPESRKIQSNGELRDSSNTFTQKPSPVYNNRTQISRKNRGDIGKVYPPTTGDFMMEKSNDLGNLKSPGTYNISTGGMNPDPEKFD